MHKRKNLGNHIWGQLKLQDWKQKGEFLTLSLAFNFNYSLVKIIVRIEVARLQVWGNLFLSHAECLTITYEEVSNSCMIKIN